MIHFAIALHCEAQPVIQRYRLKPAGQRGKARFFEGDTARLVVTGVGALSSAIGVTALGERFPEKEVLWVNVGICGAEEIGIGTALLANRIASDQSRETYYPQIPWKSPWPGGGIKTLTSPSSEYDRDWAFDMEAFGFYTAALSFASSESVQCVKIVSDNRDASTETAFSKTFITQLVADKITEIASFAEDVTARQTRLKPSNWALELQDAARERYHFTQTESHQLSRFILQLDCLVDGKDQSCVPQLLSSPDKKQFLAHLQSTIDRLAPQRIC